jgi:hypothetical protein
MPEPPKGIQLANNVTELTAIAPLKPGGADTLRQIFAGRKRAEAMGAHSPIEQIESIHYARWVILDGGTRLLFTSNFDGNLEDYLAEFAERDEGPINLIFGSCEGWPGARPVGPFIQYVRDHMVPAEYYYSAYPKHTVKEVKRALYWKQETEEVISKLLPDLADLVAAIRKCYVDHAATEKELNSKKFDLTTLDQMREKTREFFQKLARPTPEDLSGKNP